MPTLKCRQIATFQKQKRGAADLISCVWEFANGAPEEKCQDLRSVLIFFGKRGRGVKTIVAISMHFSVAFFDSEPQMLNISICDDLQAFNVKSKPHFENKCNLLYKDLSISCVVCQKIDQVKR